MTWQDAILEKLERAVSRAEFKLWEFRRCGRNDQEWEALLNLLIQQANTDYAELLTKVANAAGPLNVFGGSDYWMKEWDGDQNWLECLLLNTPPKDAVELLVHLGIMPMREVDDHWDGKHRITKAKPIDVNDVDPETGKIVPISSTEFLSIVKKDYEIRLLSIGRIN